MTQALPPALALAYVRELSADVIDGVVLGAGGAALAGNPALAAPANALLAHGSEGATARGRAFAARDGSHAIVVVTGPFALPRVIRRDLRTALGALGGERAPEAPPEPVGDALVEALLAAVADAFSRHSAVSGSE